MEKTSSDFQHLGVSRREVCHLSDDLCENAKDTVTRAKVFTVRLKNEIANMYRVFHKVWMVWKQNFFSFQASTLWKFENLHI